MNIMKYTRQSNNGEEEGDKTTVYDHEVYIIILYFYIQTYIYINW